MWGLGLPNDGHENNNRTIRLFAINGHSEVDGSFGLNLFQKKFSMNPLWLRRISTYKETETVKTEDNTMAIREEFVDGINEGFGDRIEGANHRPSVEVWPEEDDFGRWVASHEEPVRTVICGTPEFADSPYCGRGYH